jgi:hypothetical protein
MRQQKRGTKRNGSRAYPTIIRIRKENNRKKRGGFTKPVEKEMNDGKNRNEGEGIRGIKVERRMAFTTQVLR